MPPGVSCDASTAPGPLPRRVLLIGGTAAGLTGVLTACSGGGDSAAEQRAAAEAEAAADGLRRRTARDGSELLARYDATARAHPALGAPLAPFRDVVVAHQAALGERVPDGKPGSAGAAPEVPAEPAEAVTALIQAERRTAERRHEALAGATPELARLLASLAAAGSVQAYLLSEVSE